MKSISNYHFDLLAGAPDEVTKVNILNLWQRFAGLGSDEAERRISEIVLVVRIPGGEVVGVSTAVRVHVPQLQNELYSYRCFIMPEHRAPALDTQMLVRSKNYLEKLAEQDTTRKCIGIILFIQNETIKQYWRQAVWLGADMIYIGNTPQGHHMRVSYFKGAKL